MESLFRKTLAGGHLSLADSQNTSGSHTVRVKSMLVLNQIHSEVCGSMQVSTLPKASLQEIYEGTQVHTGDSRSTKVQIQSLFRAVWTLPSTPAASRETACAFPLTFYHLGAAWQHGNKFSPQQVSSLGFRKVC